jgi:phytoene dehydrogenase-like protein
MAEAPIDINIIGAGIAGLAAGCYAQMNGYRTQIFESHNLPGGLCTAWHRQGYTFDGCLHYLFGSGTGQPFYQMWEELGAIQRQEFIHHEELLRVVAPDGRILIVYSDPDRLEPHLTHFSNVDRHRIAAFCQGIRTFTRFDLSLLQQKPKALMGIDDWGRLVRQMLPFVGPVAKWGMVSMVEFANQFSDPFLRQTLPHLFGWTNIPVMVGMSLLAYMHNQNAGFPQGGSLQFARAIEKRYLELGGQIHYGAPVERVLVQADRAIGVRLYNNEEYYAKRVISACDGRGTIFDLLGGRYVNCQLKRLYQKPDLVRSQLQVSLGVNRDLSNTPHWMTYLLPKPVLIAGEQHQTIGVKHYCFDSSLAPVGKSVMIVMLPTSYDYWQRIYGRSFYDHEQIQESDILIEQLAQFYPGIKGDIEYVDVATPLTYERYTGNWLGASCGWLLTKQTLGLMITGIRKTLPHLGQFYMVGQWVEPGGSVPIVAMSGRNIIQQICHEDRKKFRTVTST